MDPWWCVVDLGIEQQYGESEETPGGSTGELPSSLSGEVCSVLAGVAPPASENDDMNDVAAIVLAEAACLAEAGILFPANLWGRSP